MWGLRPGVRSPRGSRRSASPRHPRRPNGQSPAWTCNPEIKESDEKKSVPAGEFACHRIDATVQGNTSTTWFCKDVFQLSGGGNKHGGMAAMETAGMKMWLEGMGEDAKPLLDLPKDEK